MKVFITQMLTQDGSHLYILGVFSTEETADYAGRVEMAWRGSDKYKYRIVPEYVSHIMAGTYWEDKIKWYNEINP